MTSRGRYSHAVVSRVPKSFQSVPTIDGTCIDLDRAREQQECLVQCLRNLGVDVLELPPDEASPYSVFTSDCSVTLNGIALICRPAGGGRGEDTDTVRAVLKKEIGLTVVELDTQKALLNGSDVLFTGSEFFVGIGKETNTEGALNVARTWPEYPCTPVKLEGQRSLSDRLTLAGPEVLAVGGGQHPQTVLRRIEREATNRYQTLTLPEDEAANCMYVNNTLVHAHSIEIPLSSKVFSEKISFATKEISLSEFQKTGRGLSSLCILVKKSKTIRKI